MANATASDVSIADLILNGGKARSNVTDAVTGTSLTQTISGASTLELDLHDPDRVLLKSVLCTARTRVGLDDLTFELAGVSKQQNILSLTFEDLTVATLRHQKGVVKAAAGTTSRVAFCRRLIAQDASWIVVDGPMSGPTILQEISTGTTTSTSSVAVSVLGTPVSTAGSGNSLQLTGQQAASYLYAAGFRGEALVTAVAIGYAESGLNALDVDHDSNGTTDWGFMQINSVHGYTQAEMFTPAKNAAAAFKISGGGNDFGWWSTYDKSAAHPFNNGAYRQFLTQAANAVTSFLGAQGDALDPTSGQDAAAKGNKPEDHWAAITRIMGEIQWRVFARRGHIVIAPDSWLLTQDALSINEESDGVDSIDFDVDRGKKVSTVTVTCRADRWTVLPGEPVTITDMGPANDTWLTSQIERSLTSTTATVTLIKKQKTLGEPDSGTSTTVVSEGQRNPKDVLAPFATQKLMPFNATLPKRADSATVIMHTNGGGSSNGSLFSYFSRPGNDIASHFQVMKDGTIEQYVSLDRQAYAQYAGNAFAVSIETEDDDNPSTPWTTAQIVSIVRIIKWVGCPARIAPDGPAGGIGWHQEYADWNLSGHDCPGPVRVRQIKTTVIPAVAKSA